MDKRDSFTASTGAFVVPFCVESIQSQAATSPTAKNGSLIGCSFWQVFLPSMSAPLQTGSAGSGSQAFRLPDPLLLRRQRK
jgi:hypothetical protein